MNGDKASRRLLRLRGWGRNGGIHGRKVDSKTPLAFAKETKADRIAEMRRAAVLYLSSRECVARDVAFLLLPREAGKTCVGDLMVFTRGNVFMAGFVVAKRRPAPALTRMAGRIRDLGQYCRIIHAETPAHAVEQLVRLIDGDESGISERGR